MMDSKLTEQIGTWLRANPSERDYMVGALLLLQLTGNRIMYRNLVAKRNEQYVVYNLQKYYDFRVRQLTHDQVEAMAAKVEKIAEKNRLNQDKVGPRHAAADAKDLRRGKRPDHDDLPPEIQACYVENLGLLQRMREVHLRLRTLSLGDSPCPDSERYPFLKELIALDKKYRANWKSYDIYSSQ